MSNKLSESQEIDILVRIARGDTHAAIAQELGIAEGSVGNVKRRQAKALAVINNRVAEKKQLRTIRILDRAHELLEKKLDKQDVDIASAIEEIDEWFENTDKTKEDYAIYNVKIKAVLAQKLDIKDLVSVSKEMFHESQVEQGKPTSIGATGSKEEQMDTLKDMMQALDNGDEVTLERIILNKPND